MSESTKPSQQTENHSNRLVPCPNCKTQVIWDTGNLFRPFCSERCKNEDFIAWAKEDRAMKGNSVYDDILSDNLGSD